MNSIYEGPIEGQSHVANLGPTGDILKIFISGMIDVQNADSRILGLRVNDVDKGYQSYVVQGGDHRDIRKDTTGFILGRTGWGYSAVVGIEYTLMRSIGITGFGHTTFFHKPDAQADGLFFDGDCRGVFKPVMGGISQVKFYISGGSFSGKMKIYSL